MLRSTPWGRGKFKLDASELTIEEKAWLGSQNAEHGRPIQKLHEQFGIKTRTLQKYSYNVANAIPMREEGGRPPKLESSCMDKLRSEVTVTGSTSVLTISMRNSSMRLRKQPKFGKHRSQRRSILILRQFKRLLSSWTPNLRIAKYQPRLELKLVKTSVA